MKELYEHLRFWGHPFSKFSAEEEIEYLSDIYIRPRYFDTLKADLKSGTSRFILGERGSGKSALVMELQKQLSSDNVFTVVMDSYDGISLKQNEGQLLYHIISNTLKTFTATFAKNKHLLNKLGSANKNKLAIIIRDFFTSISRRDFEKTYNSVTRYKTKNYFRLVWNGLFHKPINWAISTSLEIGSDFISGSLGLPKPKNADFYKTYLPEIKLEELPLPQKEKVLTSNYGLLKDIFLTLTEIIQASGYSSTVIFLDKIDEYNKLEGKINNIVSFTQSILTDTSLLYLNKVAIVFSIWTEVKIELNSLGVRFDKFKPIDITWTNDDIKRILEKRLNYFARKKPYLLETLFLNFDDLDELIKISHKSPRDLIRLFSIIFDEQAAESEDSNCLSSKSIEVGKIKFCKSYDYYSIFPSKRGTKEDIVSIVNKILRVGKQTFKTTDIAGEFKFSYQSGNNYVKIYKDYGLVKDSDTATGAAKEYKVIDPKLEYLIKKGHTSI